MGDRITPSRYRGIIKPDESLTWLDSEAGLYTAAGARVRSFAPASPRTGIAVPNASTDMALRASGEQTDDLDVVANRRGLPMLDEMSYLWKKQADTSSQYRGCDLPVPQAAWDPIDLASVRANPHIICTPDDYLIFTYQDAAGVTYTRTKSPTTTTWGAEITVDASTVTYGFPCLLVVPRVDGYRLILYRWTDIGSDYNIRAYHSDDQGATWTNDGTVLLENVSLTDYPGRKRVRAAYNNGQIILIGHLVALATGGAALSTDRIAQWASSDGGGRFTQIVISDGTDSDNSGAFPDLCVWRGEFVLGRLIHDGTYVVGAFRRLASAWYPWTAGSDISDTSGLTSGQHWGVQSAGGGTDTIISDGELAIWVDDVGAVYAASRHCTGANSGAHPIVRSVDGADSWTIMGDHETYAAPAYNGSVWWNAGTVGSFTSPDNELYTITGCHQRGRGVIVSTWNRAGAGSTGFHAAIYLGGWQSVPMPGLTQEMSPTKRCAWDHNGAAYYLPSESIWTYSDNAVGESETLAVGSVYQTAPALGTIWNTYAPTSTVAQGMIAEYELTVTSGTAYIEMINGNGAAVEYQVQVGITNAQVQLYDKNGAVVLGTLAYASATSVRVRLEVRGSSTVCWAMPIGALGGYPAENALPDRLWTEVGRTNALVNGGAALGHSIQFGIGASSEADWYEWPFSAGHFTGGGLYTQPDRLKFGRSLIESPSWAGYGVKLAAVTGPAATGDSWEIAAESEYPVEAMLPNVSSSPRHPHRTDTYISAPTTVTEIRYTWQRALVDAHARTVRWGVLLDGLSLPEAKIYLKYAGGYNLAGSVGYWTFVGVRTGNFIRVNSGGAVNTAVIRRDELVGCIIEEITGGVTSAASARIVANEPGYMDTTAGTSLGLVVECDNAVAFGNAPTVRIHPRRALLILDLEAHSTSFEAIQIRAPFNWPLVGLPTAPTWPPEGYAEIATFAAGPVWAWGWSPSHGRRLSTSVDVEVTEAEDGTAIPYRRKPPRRVLEWTWAEGVPMREVLQDAAPDYIVAATGGAALAFRRSTPMDVSDQLRSLNGALTAVVVCPRIDSGDSGRPDHWAAGAFLSRITSTADIDNVTGDEEYDEQGRVQSVRFEEVI